MNQHHLLLFWGYSICRSHFVKKVKKKKRSTNGSFGHLFLLLSIIIIIMIIYSSLSMTRLLFLLLVHASFPSHLSPRFSLCCSCCFSRKNTYNLLVPLLGILTRSVTVFFHGGVSSETSGVVSVNYLINVHYAEDVFTNMSVILVLL